MKERAYNQADSGQASAALALRLALSSLLRLLAPVLSFATEEAWSWFEEGSIHTAAWPEPLGIQGDPSVLEAVGEALIAVRRAKTEAKASQKTQVESLTIVGPETALEAVRSAEGDLRAVGRIGTVEYASSESLAVRDIVLVPQEA